jgi:hypothetical protein
MRRLAVALILLGSVVSGARSQPVQPQGLLCRQAIQAAERAHAIPVGLMAAIGRVESGRPDPVTAQVNPWPWTLNAEGEGAFYPTKPEALAAIQSMQARGIRSIDVGCMQINLMHHPAAFASLAQAFDPTANADYAARFLRDLYGQAGDWGRAAALYHSATPELGAEYRRKVMAVWPEEIQNSRTPLASAWAATLNTRAFAPPLRGVPPRIIPAASGFGGVTPNGRDLAAYRAAPVMLAPIRRVAAAQR